MAKEMMIIFVYDTQLVQKEEDDPSTAILYFHPTWVSDQQKTALCGQLIGTIHCLKTIFTSPKIVSLQSGKFYIIENGRYLLAIGTDRNITDWLLEHRANTLYSLVNFFHKDFGSLAKIYQTTESLSAKLYYLFETYVKMLFFGGNLFTYIPSIKLPKSASNVFTEAIHILQCCQELNNVLGGSIMYHNKVVATQLSSDLTKRLVLTDPYRIKCPAEFAEVQFDLPLGVQLLQVYISNKEFYKLLEMSRRNQCTSQYLSNKSIKKIPIKNVTAQEQVISNMKRDQSLIFTAVPEESSDGTSLSTVPSFIAVTKKQRPKFLNLKMDTSTEAKPVIKPTVTTPYLGQTSVCSTPMTDLNKPIHQKPLSICLNPSEGGDNFEKEKPVPQSSLSSHVKDKMDLPHVTSYQIITNNNLHLKRSSSLSKITDVEQQILLKDEVSPSKIKKTTTVFKTIMDPTFPVFKEDGTLVSSLFYNDYLTRNLEIVHTELMTTAENKMIVKENDPFKNFDLCENTKSKKHSVEMNGSRSNCNKLPNKNNIEHRKSLTLPLKSLSSENSKQVTSPVCNRRYSSGVQLTPLLAKLSTLAFEDRSSGFCSKETTPCDYRGLTPTQANYSFPCNMFKLVKEDNSLIKSQNNKPGILQKCILFVCGQQDIVLTLLLKEESCANLETINKLWELCTEHLGKLEKQLHHCMESQPGGNVHETEPYSYLCLNAEWDTVDRGGPWGTSDLGALTYMHRDFSNVSNLTEILMRGCDSVIYGHHLGSTEVFYHETATTNTGLPTPADPMGLVQLKAKRRLERDHSIILL